MSLKAKLEAVIYAAEEPVTLNQLAALFAADALEWKAAREAAAAEQTAEVAGVPADAMQPLPLIEQVVEAPFPLNGDRHAAAPEAPAPEAETATAEPGAKGEAPEANETANQAAANGVLTSQVVSVGEEEAYPSIVVEGEQPSQPPAEATPADAEAESKRSARQKDREVRAVLKQILDELIAGYQADGRGLEIREIAGGYRMATKPECHDAVRLFVRSLKAPLKLSLPALETLAVIAYKQPVTAPEVNEIRGVESSGVLGSLLARKLIATAGRKPVIGRPILYKTTREFLLRFGLKDVSELPSMEEFEKMAATELDLDAETTEDPETTESERQAVTAEASADQEGAASVQSTEQNGEAELESNSPAGEELAGTFQAVESAFEAESSVAVNSETSAASEQRAPAAATGEPGPAASAGHEAVPAEPGREQEPEATPHGNEKNGGQQAGQEGDQKNQEAG